MGASRSARALLAALWREQTRLGATGYKAISTIALRARRNMNPRSRIRLFYRLALLGCVLGISYLAFSPLEDAPGTPSDKLNHFLAFLVLAWLAERSYPRPRTEPVRWAFLLGFALLIEGVQSLLPSRDPSFFDLVSDGAGVLAHAFAFRLYRHIRTRGQIAPEQM